MTSIAQRRARCLVLLAELSSYLDGELSAARRRQIERHLAGCPCCDSFAASLRRAVLVCRQAGEAPLPPAVKKRARQRIAELLAEPVPRDAGRGRARSR